MTPDAVAACADMTLADVVGDLALRAGVSEGEVLDGIIESGAYEALYDEATGLWAGGPDAFADFYGRLAARRAGGGEP